MPASVSGAPAARRSARIPHQPALDGLRGLALLVMLAYHGDLGVVPGAYFTLSAFFVLSGYLITSLLLAEHDAHGRVDLKAFWGRRFRRLMPGALVGLVAVVVFGWLAADGDQLAHLRGDVLAGLGYVANWRFIASGQTYADAFASPSPVQHYWSLAIEEQFYVVLPLVVVGVLAALAWRSRRRSATSAVTTPVGLSAGGRWVLAGVLGAGALVSTWWMAVVYAPGTERAYYGTDARAGEFLVGAALAVLLARRPIHRPASSRPRWLAFQAVGVAALLATLALWATVGINDARIYRGGFLLAALLAAVLITVARRPGPLATALSWRPLRWVGAISYGVYVLHWPIFLWLTEARTHLPPWPLFGLRMAVTVGLALVSYHLIEQPIRLRRRLTGWAPVVAMPVVVAAIAVVGLLITVNPPAPVLEFSSGSAAAATAEPPPASSASAAVGAAAARPGRDRPARVLVVGDSVSYHIAEGLAGWARTRPEQIVVWNRAVPGCALGRGGLKRYAAGEGPTGDTCDQWAQRWSDDLARFRPDVVLIGSSPWDVIDRNVPALGDRWLTIGDPDYDAWLRRETSEAARLLRSTGARLVWFTQAHLARPTSVPENDPGRIDRLNALDRSVLAGDPGAVVVDYEAWVDQVPGRFDDKGLRPDGLHLSDGGKQQVAEWIAPQLLAQAELAPTAPAAPLPPR